MCGAAYGSMAVEVRRGFEDCELMLRYVGDGQTQTAVEPSSVCGVLLCGAVLCCVGTGEDVAMVGSASYGVGTVRTWLRRRYGLGGWGWGRHLCTEDVSPGGGNVRQQCVVQGT